VTESYYYEPPVTRKTIDYFIKLLSERFAIRAALENPGGSVILTNVASRTETEASAHYSSMLGSDIHLDLIEAGLIVASLSKQDQKDLLQWIDRLPSAEAARYAGVKASTVRARRKNAVIKAQARWDEPSKVTAVAPKAEIGDSTVRIVRVA
jgi:hypothetical protein